MEFPVKTFYKGRLNARRNQKTIVRPIKNKIGAPKLFFLMEELCEFICAQTIPPNKQRFEGRPDGAIRKALAATVEAPRLEGGELIFNVMPVVLALLPSLRETISAAVEVGPVELDLQSSQLLVTILVKE
jgi:hypothetical protein